MEIDSLVWVPKKTCKTIHLLVPHFAQCCFFGTSCLTRLPVTHWEVYMLCRATMTFSAIKMTSGASGLKVHVHLSSVKWLPLSWNGMQGLGMRLCTSCRDYWGSAADSQNVCHAGTIGQCCRLTECKWWHQWTTCHMTCHTSQDPALQELQKRGKGRRVYM